jgi:copper chaperone NosL
MEIQVKPMMIKPRRLSAKLAAGLVLLALLAACSHAGPAAVAQEPGNDTACALDGMFLKDFPGPKAQIHYAEGKPDFFCDLLEMFSTLLTPEQKRQVTAAFVQDMGKTDWDHPSGNWINAKTAFYVVGSKKRGSMGPTFGSFSSMQAAEKFAQTEGGKVLRFEQITPDMADLSGGVVHDTTMSH